MFLRVSRGRCFAKLRTPAGLRRSLRPRLLKEGSWTEQFGVSPCTPRDASWITTAKKLERGSHAELRRRPLRRREATGKHSVGTRRGRPGEPPCPWFGHQSSVAVLAFDWRRGFIWRTSDGSTPKVVTPAHRRAPSLHRRRNAGGVRTDQGRNPSKPQSGRSRDSFAVSQCSGNR